MRKKRETITEQSGSSDMIGLFDKSGAKILVSKEDGYFVARRGLSLCGH
jgi:hypothetical protein